MNLADIQRTQAQFIASSNTCRVCNLELPTSAVEALCDDHADGQETTTPTPQPDRPMRVIHNGNDDPGDYYPGYHPRRHG